MTDRSNGNGRADFPAERLVIVRVEDAVEPRLTARAGASYESPPQTREQAMTLVRLLLGCQGSRRRVRPVDGADRRRAACRVGERGEEPVKEQPVTIREHIHQALLAAGPVGLTIAAVIDAVAGPWSPRGAGHRAAALAGGRAGPPP